MVEKRPDRRPASHAVDKRLPSTVLQFMLRLFMIILMQDIIIETHDR